MISNQHIFHFHFYLNILFFMSGDKSGIYSTTQSDSPVLDVEDENVECRLEFRLWYSKHIIFKKIKFLERRLSLSRKIPICLAFPFKNSFQLVAFLRSKENFWIFSLSHPTEPLSCNNFPCCHIGTHISRKLLLLKDIHLLASFRQSLCHMPDFYWQYADTGLMLRSLSFVYPYGSTLNVSRLSSAVLSTGSACFPISRPIAAFHSQEVKYLGENFIQI